MNAPPLLELDRVTFGYGERPAVAGVSMRLRPGQFIGLVGPNGSGKSTLLRLAAGLRRPQQGSIALAGRPLTGLSRAEIARQIAFLPQQAILPEAFTGWEVVVAGRTPHLGPLGGISPADEAITWRALELVDAAHLAGRRVGELSGGEQQRLLLARALAQEPMLLLLDEPTAHLDLPHQLNLLDLVLRFTRTDDLAVLAVFHDLNLAATYCDEIALLRDGHLLRSGTPETVLTPDGIKAAYDLEVEVMPHPQSGRPVVLIPAVSPRSEHEASGTIADSLPTATTRQAVALVARSEVLRP